MHENIRDHYEIVIIGAGPAGVSTAVELAKKGKKVVVIEKDYSSNTKTSGIIISNTLLYLSYLYNRLKTKTSSFLSISNEINLEASFDLKKMRKYLENTTTKIFKAYKEDLNDHNVEVIEATASFIDNNVLQLTFNNKNTKKITFDKSVIATGSTPKSLPFAMGKKYIDPINIINLEKIPSSITIIGGGFVGIEYATIFKRLGSNVTIVEARDRILYTFDEFIIKKFEEYLKKDGINIIKSKTVNNIEKIGHKCILFMGDEKIESEEVFIAVGRIPNLKPLNIDSASIEMDGNYPVLDKSLKSVSNKNIYFAGDAAGKYLFLNWANYSAEIIVNDILGNKSDEFIFTFPKTLYTDPEIASIGLTESEAYEMGCDYGVIKYSFS
ncbi:MAG: NAD(P)/FAD-dependent oxidoreductase, partial [Deferribacterales bacterium]